MTRQAAQLATLLVLITTIGCTTLTVSRVKVDENSDTLVERPNGILYSLPKPLLKVEPKADGTLAVTVEYLPDWSQTYAISAKSTAAKHQLQVDVENGLLKKVVWGPDTTPVASKALDVGAATEASRLEAEQKLQEQAATKADEALKKKQTALETALKELEAAELELALKRAELSFLLDQPPTDDNDAKIAEVRLAIAVAEVKVQHAREKVGAARAELEDENVSTFSLLGASAASATNPTAPGPLFYAIVETAGKPAHGTDAAKTPSVSLKAINFEANTKQKNFETTSVQKIPTRSDPKLSPRGGFLPIIPLTRTPSYRLAERSVKHAELRLETLTRINETQVEIRKAKVALALAQAELEFQRKEAYSLKIDSSLPLHELGDSFLKKPKCQLITQQAGGSAPTCHLETSTSLVAELPPGLNPGSYKLKVSFVYFVGKERKAGDGEIEFEAEAPPWSSP